MGDPNKTLLATSSPLYVQIDTPGRTRHPSATLNKALRVRFSEQGISHSVSSLNGEHWHNSYLAFVFNYRVTGKLPHTGGMEECKRNQETEPVLHKRVTPHKQQ